MAGFSKEKEALLAKCLNKFDGDVKIDGGSFFSESHESNHTFIIQVLLEVICTLLEKEEGKRQQLFNAGYQFLTNEKVLNAHISLGSFRPLRQKFALQMYQQMNEIHKSLSPTPLQDLKFINFNKMTAFSKKFQDDFIEIFPIGKGGFGTVCKAKHKIDGIVYAVKKIPFVYRGDSDYSKVIREVKSIATLNHINVVGYNNAWVEPDEEQNASSGLDPSAPWDSAGGNEKRKRTLRHSSADFVRRSDADSENLSDSVLFLESENSLMKSSFEMKSLSESFASVSTVSNSRIRSKHFTSSRSGVESIESASGGGDESGSENSVMFVEDFKSEFLDARWILKRMHLKAFLFIQMEFCDSNLRKWLKRRIKGKELPFQKTEPEIFKEILRGVVHIHSKSIIHRDLKPQNIFYSFQSGVLKIGDFGLSTVSGKGQCVDHPSPCWAPHHHSCDLGTLPYAAPEQRRSGDYDSKVDMYSLGIILIELLLRVKTFMELDILITNITEHDILPEELIEKWPEFVDLVKSLVQIEPELRMSSKDVLNLPFLQNHHENEKRLLCDRIDYLRAELSRRSEEKTCLLDKIENQSRTIVELNNKVTQMEAKFDEQETLIALLRQKLESHGM